MTPERKEYEDARRAHGAAMLDPAQDAAWISFTLWRIANALEVIADAQLEASFRPEDGEDWKDESDEDE